VKSRWGGRFTKKEERSRKKAARNLGNNRMKKSTTKHLKFGKGGWGEKETVANKKKVVLSRILGLWGRAGRNHKKFEREGMVLLLFYLGKVHCRKFLGGKNIERTMKKRVLGETDFGSRMPRKIHIRENKKSGEGGNRNN